MQLGFNFSNDSRYTDENYILFDGNKYVYNYIKTAFENGIAMLTGLKKSGKTHLCYILKNLKGAIFINKEIFNKEFDDFSTAINIKENKYYILEDIKEIISEERKLLFLINTVLQKNAKLLITSTRRVNEYEFKIEDLKSRFLNIENVVIGQPDEGIKRLLILKLFSDKQIKLENDALEFLAKHLQRNYEDIYYAVEKISNSLEKKKNQEKITVPFLKGILNSTIV